MFTLRGRIICGGIWVLLGAGLLAAGQAWGWACFFMPGLLVFGYFRYGTLVLAFNAYHKGDYRTMREQLQAIRWPQWLNAQHRAYFALLSGVAAYKDGNLLRAQRLLSEVPTERLRTDNMRAILECHRAEIALAAQNRRIAEEHIGRARALPHKPEVAAALGELERQLAAV